MRTVEHPTLRYAGLVFWVWKKFYRQSFNSFTKEDMNDWRQEAYSIALELYRQGYTEDDKRTILATAQKRWHEWLKEMGYIKPKHRVYYKSGLEFYVLNILDHARFHFFKENISLLTEV